VPSRRLPRLSGQSLHPAPTSHLTRAHFTRHQRGFKQFTRPVFPSPAAVRMERATAWAFPQSFAPRRPGADNARQGGDRPSSTDLKLLAQHHISVDPPIGSSLTACDLVSQRQRWASPRPRRSGAVIGHAAGPAYLCGRALSSPSGLGSCGGACGGGRLLREVVARRLWMAGGRGRGDGCVRAGAHAYLGPRLGLATGSAT
jgi:hypothetical protein